jgi:hypothetical protein
MWPSGATSESDPSTGFSETTMTRSGAPFHGPAGDGKTVISAASAQVADAAAAGDVVAESSDVTSPAATSDDVAATENHRARSMLIPTFPEVFRSKRICLK